MSHPRTAAEIVDLAGRIGKLPEPECAALGVSSEDRETLARLAERMRTRLESAEVAAPTIVHPATTAGVDRMPDQMPQRVGRYRIERLIAQGGMGRVWSAVDETLQRTVALKDVRPEVSQDDARRRFVDEAKITARLEHPGIVPVYDMPAGESGPTYVMRYVHGKTLARAIGEHHHRRRNGDFDSVEFFQLLQAFRSVCQTVAYAHAQNVLHRDLKPANILLGDFGEALVLDWGLAKLSAAMPAPVAEGAVTETQAGQLMGTPAYMSPEQADDPRALTARSDVWSLGVILYEILAGQLPFYAERIDAILAKIRNDAPLTPRALNANVARGLEAVCLKALHKDPAARYASAGDLADDIARWLADEPVRAFAEPWRLRAARWARRHKAFVASSGVLLLSAVVALAIGTFFIERQRQRAETNLKAALDVVDSFFVTVSENRLLNEPGLQTLRAELLQSAVAFSEKFAQENAADPARQADLARVQLLLGRVLVQLKDAKRAQTALETARANYADLSKAYPAAVEPKRGAALATLNLGNLQRQSDPAAAEQHFRDAIARYERLRKEAPRLEEAGEKLALALNSLATLKKAQDQLDESAALYESAISLMEALAAAAPDNIQYADDLAGFHANFAEVWMKRKNLPEMRKHLEASGAIRQRLARRGLHDLNLEDSLAASQNHLGHLAMMEGKFPQAETHFRQALAMREALVRRNPDVLPWRKNLADAHAALAKSLGQQSRAPEAIAEAELCLAAWRALAQAAPDDPGVRLDLGRAALNKSYYVYDAGRLDDAEQSFTEAIDQLEALRAKNPDRGRKEIVDAYWTRAMVRVDRGRLDAAVADYDRAIALDPGPQRPALRKEREAALRKGMK